MEDNVFKELEDVDILDIYDEITEVPISDEQMIKMCRTIPCKVDLRRCNLVYAVEKKYKDKLSTYKKTKLLKWLNVNIPKLFTNAEAKYLKWHKRLEDDAKVEWLYRKSQVLQLLTPPINVSSESSDEDSEKNVENVLENNTESNISTASDNTFNTVIPSQFSQPKSNEELGPGFSSLINASLSLISGGDIQSQVTSSQDDNVGTVMEYPIKKSNKKKTLLENPQLLSEGFSSQGEQFPSFSLDNMVTSTQEF